MTLQNLHTADAIPQATFCPWVIPLIVPRTKEFPANLPENSSRAQRHPQAINMPRGKEFRHAEDFAWWICLCDNFIDRFCVRIVHQGDAAGSGLKVEG